MPAAHTKSKTASGQSASAAKPLKFIIDFEKPASDGVFDGAAFEKFLHDRIKVEGRTGQLGDNVRIEKDGQYKLAVVSSIPLSKRYLKYLTKKFLKKNEIRNYLRVIATNKQTLSLRYFMVDQDESGDDE